MSSLSTLPKGDSAWLLRKSIQRIMQQVSVLETNIGSSTTGNSADTQVIFNDAGTLRGDTGLTYDKSADRLSFGAGICYGLLTSASATITGDLTVATDAFKVISSTKDVCIGTTTPTFNNKLTVVGGAGGDAFITSGNGTRTGYIGTDGTSVIMGAYSNHALRIHVNDLPQMEVAALGVFNWYDGAGGTRMTLNSTGLGVGVVPSAGKGALQLSSGINFPATQVASSDANTLDDYEEGTWTPTVTATAGTLTTTTVNAAAYTKIGRLVSVQVDISIVDIGTASGLLLFSLPTGLNQVTDANVGVLRELGATGQMGQMIYQSATQVAVALYNNGTMIVNGYRFRGTYTYTAAT